MMWRRPRLPAKPKIADFGFEAFDLKPQGPAGGKDKLNKARGRLGFLKTDIQEIENERLVSTMKAQARDLENTPEMQARPAALATASAAALRGVDPVEPRRNHRELLGIRQISHIADPDQGVLEICRDDRKIVGVEGDQSRKVRHRRFSTFAIGLSSAHKAAQVERIGKNLGIFKHEAPDRSKEMHVILPKSYI